MRTVEIRVNKKIMRMLDGTIMELKKHRKGKISYDDALNHLFKTIEELKAKKRAIEKAKHLLQMIKENKVKVNVVTSFEEFQKTFK